MKAALCLLLAAAALGFGVYRVERPRVYPPGVLIPEEPAQTDLPAARAPADPPPPPRLKGEWTCRPLANFSLRARVLHVRDYPRATADDPLAEICPRDVAVSWSSLAPGKTLGDRRLPRKHCSWELRCARRERARRSLPPGASEKTLLFNQPRGFPIRVLAGARRQAEVQKLQQGVGLLTRPGLRQAA